MFQKVKQILKHLIFNSANYAFFKSHRITLEKRLSFTGILPDTKNALNIGMLYIIGQLKISFSCVEKIWISTYFNKYVVD